MTYTQTKRDLVTAVAMFAFATKEMLKISAVVKIITADNSWCCFALLAMILQNVEVLTDIHKRMLADKSHDIQQHIDKLLRGNDTCMAADDTSMM